MSNPFVDVPDEEILEGFLCPICKKDLKTPERLTNHVETLHSEEKDLLQSLKQIFSKAKKKILNFDDVELAKTIDNSLNLGLNRLPLAQLPPLRKQEIGTDCSHMSYFKAVRNPRLERYASETNKLIIRLAKLLDNRPVDPIQRRLHEQKLIPWLDGNLVKLCPGCAKSFHIARRQHHCRLCGSLMCNDCSCHLELDVAFNLIKSIDSNTSQLSTAGSTNGLPDSGREPETLRTCDHCFHLLMTCKEKQDAREKDVPIKRLYDRIATIRSGVAPDIPNYSKIIKSLYDGDSHHTLAEASALREKLGRSAELMDGVSKHVLALPCAAGSREEALKKAIRLACVRYIKEEMLAIPPIPLEAEIKKLQAKRLQETARNIERDRRLAMEAFEKYELTGRNSSYPPSCHSDSSNEFRRGPNTPSKNSTASGSTLRAVDNWSGFQSQSTGNKQFGADLDPLVVQMQIIKGYIRQAKEAMRFEEVTTLEANLRELQQEYYNQKLNTEERA